MAYSPLFVLGLSSGGEDSGQFLAAVAAALGAILSAIISAIVAWITARRSVRAELTQIKLGVHQKLLEQLVEARLSVYPELYSYLSDLGKAVKAPEPAELQNVLDKINRWDSHHAILLGPETTNVCFDFRRVLARAVKAASDPANRGKIPRKLIEEGLEHAELLELALRSDLGIYGVELEPGPDYLDLPIVESYYQAKNRRKQRPTPASTGRPAAPPAR